MIKSVSKEIMQYIADVLIAFSIFFFIVSFIPSKENVDIPTDSDMKFVFHASASQREMFFAENELDDILSWDLKDDLIDYLDKEFAPKTWDKEEIFTKDQIKSRECKLPREWDKLKHWESVFAYKQRSDVSSICDVERRTCLYWKLDWSYNQRSCREIVKYTYTKEPVVTYNSRPTNLYIQPPKLAPNRNEEFSMEWKVNEKLISIDHRNNNINNPVIAESPNLWQIKVTKKDCITPRGEVVKHSHLVKAYRSNLGFSNNYCDVELRMCLDGELEWTYQYPYCEHHDVPDEDYLLDELSNPNSEDDEFNIWQLVEWLF